MAELPTDDNSGRESDNLVDMDDLDSFEKNFFQLKDEPEAEESEDKEVDENRDNSPAPDEDKDATNEVVETSDEDEGEPEEQAPKDKPKSKAQKRIEELVTEARVAQRERDAFARENAALKALSEKKPEAKTPNVREDLPADAPDPDAINDKGEAVYPLGEFDPKFVRELNKFAFEQEMKAYKEQVAVEAKAEEHRKTQEALAVDWTGKIEEFEMTHEDARESISELAQSFENIDPIYGDYLAMTIMSSEVGPEIMYHLSQNIGEAQKIVASGPQAATFAIARLEAKFLREDAPEVKEDKRNTKKVSEASPPPEIRTRGQGGKFAVSPDTDDLDAFEKVFFKTK